MVRDVVIIGAGPAGISASVYLQRVGLKPLVLEKGRTGGLLLNANLVENYPGFPDGIGGRELVGLFREQLDHWGIEVRRCEVRKVVPADGCFKLLTSEDEIESRTVVLATGTKPKEAGISGENELKGARVFYEIRDMPEEEGRDYIVVGSGDAAFDYAMNLSRRARRVDIVFRSKPKCIGLLLERVLETENIHLLPGTEPDSLSEVNGRLRLSCSTSEGEKHFDADYVLIACGREPNWVEVEDMEVASAVGDGCETALPGLFVAGDVKRGNYRQVGIAVGDGLHTAMSIADFLERGGER
ncbi:MAG: NAD(P)/FAD-dependent oxidoreductase [Methanomassiliicoccales archaeon]|nr:MAG: NAD(P)/FAD-dependent oxidoreductase [Methanomassiliicoccales archaeon]